jgi:uncharacterized protein (DUF1330 family)
MRACLIGLAAALLATTAAAQTAPAKPGFLIVVGEVTDRAKMGDYAKALAPIYASNGGRYIGFGGPGRGVACVAGPCEKHSIVIVQFKDYPTLDSFWWGEDYRKAVRARDRAGVFTVFGAEGVGATPYSGGALLLMMSRQTPDGYVRSARLISSARVATKAAPLITGTPGAATALEGLSPYDRVELLSFPDTAARGAFVADKAVQRWAKDSGAWLEMLAVDPPPAPAAPLTPAPKP